VSWLFQPLPLAQGAPTGDITGVASFAFTATGAFTGGMAGTATMTFTVNGTLIDLRKSLVLRPRTAVLMPLLHY